MSHFARVNAKGIVEYVIVAEQDFIDTLPDATSWVQTSYNTRGGVHLLGGTPLRKNYAGVGYSYDKQLDAFIPQKPFSSWTLNEETCLWDAPVPYPNDGNNYFIGIVTNVITSLGYTPENVANKSDSYTVSSSTTYASTKALVDGLATKQNTITGAATSITSSNLTASKAVVSDSSGKVATSSTTSTEIGYVAGVTSAIQTQLDGKLSFNQYITGLWTPPLLTTYNAGANFHNIAYYVPIIIQKTTIITDIGLPVATGVATGAIRLAIYNSNSSGLPSTVAYQTASLDASSNGFKSETFASPLTLSAGLYYVASQVNIATVNIRFGNTLTIVGNNANATTINNRQETKTFGAFTDNPTTVSSGIANGVSIMLKVQ